LGALEEDLFVQMRLKEVENKKKAMEEAERRK
jgi:hypothetical protein